MSVRTGRIRPMRRIRRPSIPPGRSLVLLVFLLVASGVAPAQGGSAVIPENAHAKSYGSGWECDRGYQLSNGGCEIVQLPANAFSTSAASSYGRGWECGHGY
jgi:hypothetical protein